MSWHSINSKSSCPVAGKCRESPAFKKTREAMKLVVLEVDNIIFINNIVCACVTNVYDPSVRDFGPISKYTLFSLSNSPVKIKVSKNSKSNTISNL